MNELGDLYQELILDHKRSPRNFREMPDATRVVDGHNPLCGDELRLFVRIAEGRLVDVSFVGVGCAISVASASMLTDAVRGKTVEDALRLFNDMHDLLTNDHPKVAPADLGNLGVLAGVHQYPSRVKCATLCWHTLNSALGSDEEACASDQ